METQAKGTQPLNKLCEALSKEYLPARVEEVRLFYEGLKKASWRNDYEICLTNTSRFADAVFRMILHKILGEDATTIDVVASLRQLEESTTIAVNIEELNILRFCTAVYSFRNPFDSNRYSSNFAYRVDCSVAVATANWVLEELGRLYLADLEVLEELLAYLSVKQLAIVEIIDGDPIILTPNTSARVQLELILYMRYPTRTTEADLIKLVKNNHNANNVQVTLRTMLKKSIVHENADGWLLTQIGIAEAESEILKLDGERGSSFKTKKGVQRARKSVGRKRTVSH